MKVSVTKGDLLDADVDVVVNGWNRNIFSQGSMPFGSI